jgi:hypothetical protein
MRNCRSWRGRLYYCNQPDDIVEFFRKFQPFKMVVEATASYLWFVELVEPLAGRLRGHHTSEGSGDTIPNYCRELCMVSPEPRVILTAMAQEDARDGVIPSRFAQCIIASTIHMRIHDSIPIGYIAALA